MCKELYKCKISKELSVYTDTASEDEKNDAFTSEVDNILNKTFMHD